MDVTPNQSIPVYSDNPPPPPPPPAPQSLGEAGTTYSPPITPPVVPPPPITPPPPPNIGSVGPSISPTPAVSVPPSVPRRGFPVKLVLFLVFGLAVIILVALVLSGVLKLPFLQRSKAVTLTYWGLWEQESVLRPLFDEFKSTHPQVTVEYSLQSPTEYRERLQSALSQGKGPDIFRIHNTWVPMLRSDLAAVPSNIYTPEEFQSTFYPDAHRSLRWANNYLAIPLEYDGLAMFVNSDLVTNSGIAIPKDWDDLRNAALTISRCEGPGNNVCDGRNRVIISGVAMGNTANVDHWQDIVGILLYQNNVDPANPNANTTSSSDVLEYFASFDRVHHIWNSSLLNSTTEFATGRVGFYFGPSWRIFDIQALNPDLKFSVHPLPQLPVEPTRGENLTTWASYWAEAVNRRSPNDEIAWELLKFLSSSEAQTKFYQNAVNSPRAFGEPYSRVDLSPSIASDPWVGAYINQAPLAKSWYLASSTNDGPSGINSRISELYAKAISGELELQELSNQLSQVLSEYGITASVPSQ